MGVFSTIIGFGAGYVLGARRGVEPLRKLPARAREALSAGAPSGSSTRKIVDLRDIREVMTAAPETIESSQPLVAAARLMRENDIGDLIVTESETDTIAGIVTDRDIVVRGIAQGRDPKTTTLQEICSRGVATLEPTAKVQDAIRLMRETNVRRLPVVESGHAIGIISLGDLSLAADADPVLADLSTAPPDR
jgi:CBS domain-containing protein